MNSKLANSSVGELSGLFMPQEARQCLIYIYEHVKKIVAKAGLFIALAVPALTAHSLTVTPSANADGSISPAIAQTVGAGETATFTVTPNAGFFASMGGTCGGRLVENTFTTAPVTADCTVEASFTAGIRLIVTSTAGSGPETWASAVTIINSQTCNAPTKRIEFNIPAATDPGCNPATGACVVQLGIGTAIVCPNVVVDGYTQPGAVANTATDHTNNAQLKIEFAGTNALFLGHNGIILRGIAFAAVQVTIGVRNVFGAGLVNTFSQIIAGNYFGWRADGLTPAGFNGEHRLAINNGQSVNVIGARVGGPNPPDRNLITHTLHGNGLRLSGATNTLVEGNVFNLDRNGNPAAGADSSQGILLDVGGNNANTIRRNVITKTKVSGVQCTGGSGTTLTENEIFDVGTSGAANARGIELQPGCNRNQTAPVITSVTAGTAVNVQGTLTSVPNENFEIEFFNNVTPDTANIGRAETFVGFVEVTTNASGVANFGVDLPANVRNLSSTATRISTGDTSAFSAATIPLNAVVSRKIHGSAGSFDLVLNTAEAITGAVTVEPRGIGAGHTIVFQLGRVVSAVGSVTVVDGTNAPVNASAQFSGPEVIVTIPALADNKRVTISLASVTTVAGPAIVPPVSLGFLVGDINNSRSVNASDISGVKARSGQVVTAANFLFDLNASGSINSSDISAVKARSGLVLP